jgi:hypothetical protein
VCLGLSHQLFAGVIERARAAAFFADVASVGGCLFSEAASLARDHHHDVDHDVDHGFDHRLA